MIRNAAFGVLFAFLAHDAWASSIDRRIDAMSDEEKIAQLLFVGFAGQIENETMRELVGKWRVGGVVLYAHNLEHSEQARRLNESIVRSAGKGIVPFIAIDQEGGMVRRLRLRVPVAPSAMAIGATRSPELSRRAGAAVGSALRALGFTMNFAPVLDVLTNRDNAAIGTRAFSDDPTLVAMLGASFIAGQQHAGVIAVGKHFPGLGAVGDDPHHKLPRLDATTSVLRNRELVPFAAAFRSGLAAVMTAHVALPRIAEAYDVPATLSPRIMKGLLRDEMHFDGIAITDALQMEALADNRGADAHALAALLAGSDMVLALGNAQERSTVFNTLIAAYRDGRLPKRRVREALRRILAAKDRIGIAPRLIDDPTLADDIAARALTLVPGSAVLPELRDGFLYVGPEGSLQKLLAPKRAVTLPDRIAATEADGLLAKARGAASGTKICVAAAANQAQFAIISHLRAELPDLTIVFVNLGSPWRTLTGPRTSTLLTYAEDAPSQAAAARVLLGDAHAQGTAPVSLVRRP